MLAFLDSDTSAIALIGSLRNHDGDAEDKWFHNFSTYESRDTLKSFTLFIARLNLGHIDKFEIKIKKINHRGSRSLDNAEFGPFTLLFCRKEMYQEFRRRCTAIVLLVINVLCRDVAVAVAVAVVVFLSSPIKHLKQCRPNFLLKSYLNSHPKI